MVFTAEPLRSSWMRTLVPGDPVYDHAIVWADLRAQLSPPFGTFTVTEFTTVVVVVVVDGRVVDVVVVVGATVVVVDPVVTVPELGSTISDDSSTASKSDPWRDARLWRSLSFQRLSGAPLMYHELPLSATIPPYAFSACRMTWLAGEKPETSTL